MATAARQPKSGRKPMPEPAARRAPAWSGARASPTFSPSNGPARLPNNASPAPAPAGGFPPLGQTTQNGTSARGAAEPDRNLQALSGLTGTTVTVTTRSGPRYEGVVASTANEGDTSGLTLRDARDVTNPGGPIKDRLFVPSTNLASWTSGPADAKLTNDSFKTDVDISQKTGPRRERELQAWADDSVGLDLSSTLSGGANSPSAATVGHGVSDALTFGAGASTRGNAWDQFATNEKLFGVKTGFDENLYTTKIDRSAPDFKERERKAQIIANEIMGATASNPHVAEERQTNTLDDSGVNEEDKYGAVVRSNNAYVPPGARKGDKVTVPKVSVNAPDGSTQSVQQPTAPATPASAVKPPAEAAFRDFVTNERQRLTQKKQAIVKNEMQKRMADLLQFSQSFKLNKPIPEDLVQILAKDEDKQKALREKSEKDAVSGAARSIAVPSSTATPAVAPVFPTSSTANPVKLDAARSKAAGLPPSTSAKVVGTTSVVGPAKDGKTVPASKANGKPVMSIQGIPPFKGRKAVPLVVTNAPVPSDAAEPPLSPNSARLNANASSFRPNPKASTFSPPPASAVTSPKAKPATPPQQAQPNPFFGTKPVKKATPASIRDDFNPFKYNKVAEANAVGAMWPYNGKRYMQMYPPAQVPPAPPVQSSPHMAPPPIAPQPMPQGPYEEDPATQAARAAGYVYAYPPYGYPGAPMMPGMPPPGPPGAYMPGPYMQPMHYPPPMAPNGQPMYTSPPMGQMHPHGSYMAPPPHGAYPPPPNGAGPRSSMPPTPIPAHAHPYYQHSPQLQHAVPYQMMMAPPPGAGSNGPQHPYDAGPAPAPMGGVPNHS